MPCGLVFRYIRTRLEARNRRREERLNGENDLNSPKESSKRTSTSENHKARASILIHTGKLVKAFSITPRSKPGVSASPWATLSNSLPPRSQPPQEAQEVSVDPAKSYLTRLPRELKLEIIDHICSHQTRFVNDPTEVAFSKRSNLINLRLTCCEFALLAAPALFQELRLTEALLQNEDQWKEFLKDVLPLIAPHVRLLWLWLRVDSPDEDIASAISLLQNVTWVSLCMEIGEGSSKTLVALEALPDLQKLTFRIWPSYDEHENTVFQRLLEAHANRITALYIHFDWGFVSEHNVFVTIRDKLPRLTTLHVVAARRSNLDALLLDEKPWACQDVLTSVHFQELIEIEARLVPKMVNRFRNLTQLVISSCGPFGTYGDALGKEQALESMMQSLPEVQQRQPLEGLRIVHFTDMEARWMSPTPTVELVVNDPLDQVLFGRLLMRNHTFPGLRKLTVEYINDESGEARGLLENACTQRGVELVFTGGGRDAPR